MDHKFGNGTMAPKTDRSTLSSTCDRRTKCPRAQKDAASGEGGERGRGRGPGLGSYSLSSLLSRCPSLGLDFHVRPRPDVEISKIIIECILILRSTDGKSKS